jgi:hypothetical protein
VLAVVVVAFLFGFDAAATATTTVSGEKGHETPLEIDPTQEPSSPETAAIAAYYGQIIMFVQRMPETKLVNQVTLGDLGRQSGCTAAAYNLFIRESPTGAADINQHTESGKWEAASLQPITFPEEPGKVTWQIQPTVFKEGYAYSFWVNSPNSSCQSPFARTWAHNETRVDGGTQRCDGANAAYDFRMWHEAGQSDALVCPKYSGEVPSGFAASMPTGWLRVGVYNWHPYVYTVTGQTPGEKSCPGNDEEVFWRVNPSSPSWNDYVCRWSLFNPLGEETGDGWYYAGGGMLRHASMRDAYLKLEMDAPDVAAYFKPSFYFDTSESWRPLGLDEFFKEIAVFPGPSFLPAHNVCLESIPVEEFTTAGCSAAEEPEDLVTGENDVESARLDIDGYGLNGAIQEYATPGCSPSEELWDCSSGSSAMYWRLTPSEFALPAGPEDPYQYVHYWQFYRVNSFSDSSDHPDSRHEGDWEAVAVAPSRERPGAFDFVSFTQHGVWYSYLRENLRCVTYWEECGTEASKATGLPVKVFVANGSHANYPEPCSETVAFLTCWQNVDPLPERGHDGSKAWWHNGNWDQGLLAMPTDPSSWTYWPGKWGVTESSPGSPGLQTEMFDQSWGECADDNDGCPLPPEAESSMTTAAVTDGQRSIRGPFTKSCERWFGSDVAAVLCEAERLGSAVGAGQLARPGGRSLSLLRGSLAGKGPASVRQVRADSAPGLGQVVGPPMRVGDRLSIEGLEPTPRWQVLIRAFVGTEVIEARFRPVPLGEAELVVRNGVPGLRFENGRLVKPDALRVPETVG